MPFDPFQRNTAPFLSAQYARAVVIGGLLILASSSQTQAASADGEPLILYASNVSKAAIEPLVPICARFAGTQVQAQYANNPAVAKDIADGAHFDVAVIETHMLEDLSKTSHVAKSSIRRLAALRMAIATRESGPDPRLDSIPAFKRALIGARSIGYIGNGHSGALFLEVVDRLKLRGKLKGKLVPFTGAYAEAAQASERLHMSWHRFSIRYPRHSASSDIFPHRLTHTLMFRSARHPEQSWRRLHL